jgi:hypothetical protein
MSEGQKVYPLVRVDGLDLFLQYNTVAHLYNATSQISTPENHSIAPLIQKIFLKDSMIVINRKFSYARS